MASSTISSVINTGLPSAVPENFTDPQVRAAVALYIQANQNLLNAIEQYCGVTQKDMTTWSILQPSDTLLRQNLGRLYVPASEAIGVGALINLHNNAGVLSARNARSDVANKEAHGYSNVLVATALGARLEVILSQGLLIILGVNIGDKLWLSATPGAAQIAPDLAAGHLEQFIGLGVAANLAYINIAAGTYIQH